MKNSLVLVLKNICCGVLLLLSLNVSAASLQAPSQHRLSAQISDNNQLHIAIDKQASAILSLLDIQMNYQSATQWQLLTSTARTLTLQGTFDASVDFYRHVEDNQPRIATLEISLIEGGFRLHSTPEWGRQVTLVLKDLNDHVFGLTESLQPDNRLSPDLRNAVVNVDINAEDASIQENYASAYSAFYMSSLGYGAFFDTFARGTYSMGINDQHRIHHDGGELDWYVFTGDNGAQIHQSYFALIGQPKSVPAWGLGPVGWRDHNESADEILADIQRLTDLEMPFTSWFVDRPYSDGTHAWSQMNFSKKFAEPEKWIAKINNDYGLEFMTWTTTAFFGDRPLAKHLNGHFSYLDLSDDKSVNQFKQKLNDLQYSVGVKGHKIDRADEHFPQYEPWQDGSVLPAYRRNYYAYLMAKIHDEALREKWGDDQLSFVRTAYHRTQPFVSAIWAGDPRTSWEGLQANFANAMRSSFMGFPIWGTDVGGYQGEGYIPEDLYLRWMQAGSMTGLFEIKLDGAGGEGRDRMPWQYSQQMQQQLKSILDDRMQLLPYLYSLAQTSSDNGTLMQPMAYRHLDDAQTYDLWDQFYVGDILVAPVFEQSDKRSVYLPSGKWHDFDNPAQVYQGGKHIEVEAPLSKFPRFIKANSLYVSGHVYKGNDKVWNQQPTTLTIHVYPGTKGEKTQFDYVNMLDNDHKKVISIENNGKQIVIISPALAHARQFSVALQKRPNSVTLNGNKVEAHFDAQARLLTVNTDNPDDVRLLIGL